MIANHKEVNACCESSESSSAKLGNITNTSSKAVGSSHSKPVAVYSAPGKALVAGGYLVLFPEFSAFSAGLSCRMYSACYPSDHEAPDDLEITSPQFDSSWRFPQNEGTHHNPFLLACYKTVCTYFNRAIKGRIILYSDSGFHSQTNAVQNHFFNKFSYYGKPIIEVPKTGLGSSAALTVVVVAAMSRLAHIDSLTTQQLHNLAQIAHCIAQGKIGSGFDVATAIYGTILYSRFEPDAIPSDTERHHDLKKSVDTPWKMRYERKNLAKNIHILIGDVSRGSETPGMVQKVLEWKARKSESAATLFKALNSANMDLVDILTENNFIFSTAQAAVSTVRHYLQALTVETNVPIEPQSQTRLLNKVSTIPGVVGGVVPGAGGDDAVCVIVDTSVIPMEGILADLKRIVGVKWMNLGLEFNGLREENPDEFTLRN